MPPVFLAFLSRLQSIAIDQPVGLIALDLDELDHLTVDFHPDQSYIVLAFAPDLSEGVILEHLYAKTGSDMVLKAQTLASFDATGLKRRELMNRLCNGGVDQAILPRISVDGWRLGRRNRA
jgi:hypothetical protein